MRESSFYLKTTFCIVLALVVCLTPQGASAAIDADDPAQVTLVNPPGPQVAGVIALTLDDGTSENQIGDVGQFIWINRFTPAAGDFPFALTEVQAVFGGTAVPIGGAVEIVLHQDTDADGDPGTGAVQVGSATGTVQFNDNATFSVFPVNPPVAFCGPGDVLIGVINRYGAEGTNDFPANLDTTATQGRSWAASYLAGDVPANPTYPADEQWGTIDSFGFPGNWVVRGTGSRAAIEADLSLIKTGVDTGSQIVYTLTVTDTGSTCGASGVVVSDMFPAGVTYVSDDCGGINGAPWVWNVGTLASGASAVCNITVDIDAGAVFPLVNTATVVSDQTDPNSANDSSTFAVAAPGGTVGIPTLSTLGLGLLIAVLALFAVAILRRRQSTI